MFEVVSLIPSKPNMLWRNMRKVGNACAIARLHLQAGSLGSVLGDGRINGCA